MKSIFSMFYYMVKQITQEMMMVMLAIAPFLAGFFFKLGIPALENTILVRYQLQNILVPYYELFSWLLAMLIGMLFAFVGGLVVLGEIDDHIAKYVMVTPVGMKGYLCSRIIIPALISGVVACICVPVFSLAQMDFLTLLVMILSTMFSGIVTALLVVAISSNKVEGMAVGKLSGLFGMTFFIPFFVKGWVQYIFFAFPMFWIGEWSVSGEWQCLLLAFVEYVIWIYFLLQKFRRKAK